jgi:tetratricopeptide (TPR) repeat protein
LPFLQWAKLNKEVVIISFILFSVYSYATVKRNPDWKNNMTLFSTDVKKATNSTQAHHLYGNELIIAASKTKDTTEKRNLFTEGMKHLRRSAAINPGYGENYEIMGFAYSELFINADSAIYYYKKCISTSRFAMAYNNLGVLYEKLHRFSLASYYYNAALKINPNLPDALQNSERLKKQTGLDVHEFPGEDKRDNNLPQKVTNNNPPPPVSQAFKTLFDSGAVLVEQQKYKEAIKYFERARMVQPENMDNLLYLANCYGITNNHEKAIKIYEKMLTVTPFDTVIMNDLALTYLKNGQKAKSDALYKNVRSYRN